MENNKSVRHTLPKVNLSSKRASYLKTNDQSNMIKNEMRIMFMSKSQNEGFARVTAAAFISSLDPVVSELVDVKTAVSEAISNAIVHGYDQNHGIITMDMRIFEDGTIEITISDQGKGIENIEKAMEAMYTTKKDEERAGMGFTVMETFMDTVLVESEVGAGTIVTMKKKLTLNDTY